MVHSLTPPICAVPAATGAYTHYLNGLTHSGVARVAQHHGQHHDHCGYHSEHVQSCTVESMHHTYAVQMWACPAGG